jgi:nitrate reductase NapE component
MINPRRAQEVALYCLLSAVGGAWLGIIVWMVYSLIFDPAALLMVEGK